MTQRPAGCGWVLLVVALLGWLAFVSACFPLPLGDREAHPTETAEDCARGALARPELYPELPPWAQGMTAEGWAAVLRACSACMATGDAAKACSKRMWGG